MKFILISRYVCLQSVGSEDNPTAYRKKILVVVRKFHFTLFSKVSGAVADIVSNKNSFL